MYICAIICIKYERNNTEVIIMECLYKQMPNYKFETSQLVSEYSILYEFM